MPIGSAQVGSTELLSEIRWAMEQGVDAGGLAPLLERLLVNSEPHSEERFFARQQLAELIVEQDPWRAAVLSRQSIREHEDDRSYAVLGLAFALMGHYKSAASAYRRALALEPACASYAHNLGHMLDVALNRPEEALRYLECAFDTEPCESEIAASYAHALFRTGQGEDARTVLATTGRSGFDIDKTLDCWARRLA